MKITYPGGKRCAFSVFDDTDVATLASIRPLYDYLRDLGILTTKSVWGCDYLGSSDYAGSDTLENEAYATYMRELRRAGFEIGFHGASMESSERPRIEEALSRYHKIFGEYPSSVAAHGRNKDNLYWGADRFAFGLTRRLYALLRGDDRGYFEGHLENSAYFWGDLAQRHTRYVRSFTFTGLNLLDVKSPVVYRSQATPWVNAWFLSNDAENVEEFNQLLSGENQDALERDGGFCIVSTHFGKGFVEGDRVNTVTRERLTELSQRDCWFAPVSQLLDFYVSQFGCPVLGGSKLLRLELKWFVDSLRRRRQRRAYRTTELEYLSKQS